MGIKKTLRERFNAASNSLMDFGSDKNRLALFGTIGVAALAFRQKDVGLILAATPALAYGTGLILSKLADIGNKNPKP